MAHPPAHLPARQAEMFVGDRGQARDHQGDISQHPRLLADNGLIARRRNGNKIIYRIEDKKLVKLLDAMKKLYCPDFKI